MSTVDEVTDQNFEQDVVRKTQPTLVHFWAQWSQPCQQLTPVLQGVAEQYDERASVVGLNVDDYPAVAERYGVKGIPTLIVFRDGHEQDRITGSISREAIERLMNRNLSEA